MPRVHLVRSQDITYSVIVPLFNAEGSIRELCKGLKKELESLEETYEVILVDDASSDNTLTIIQQLTLTDEHITVLTIETNRGQIDATHLGIIAASGEMVITIDDDLQYSPSEIKKLIDLQKTQGLNFVFGTPASHNNMEQPKRFRRIVGGFLLRQLLMPAYKHVRFYTSFRLFKKDALSSENNHLLYIWEFDPKRMAHIEVLHQPRKFNSSGYNLKKALSFYYPVVLYLLWRSFMMAIISLIAISVLVLIGIVTGNSIELNYLYLLAAYLIALFGLLSLKWVIFKRLSTFKKRSWKALEVIYAKNFRIRK